MELILVIHRLWRRRIAVGLSVVVAAAMMYGIGPASAGSSAIAWSRVLLDTKDSQLVVADPKAADTVSWRAEMLTHLMTTPDAVSRLAQRSGVPRDSLDVVEPDLNSPLVRSSLAFAGSQAAESVRAPYVLRLEVDSALPLISFSATAPTGAQARRIVEAALADFKAASSPGGTYTSPIATAGGAKRALEPFSVEQVSPVREEFVVGSGGYARTAALVLILFLVWCGGVALLPELLAAVRLGLRGPSPTP